MSAWRKSSFSNGSGGNQCVEVFFSPIDGGTVVRNSKRPEGGRASFTAAEWAAFIEGVKKGEFDGS